MRIVILYGSQTGTAQDVAEQIWRESRSWGFTGPVLSLDDYGVQQNMLHERVAIFVVATTGDGVEPDNMRYSWRFLLRRILPLNSLRKLRFAVLGLGDSTYTKFNYAAKKLSRRLLQLGAKELLPVGLCDDQDEFAHASMALPWIEQLWSTLRETLTLPRRNESLCAKTVFKWHLQVLGIPPPGGNPNRFTAPVHNSQKIVLRHNQRTTATDHFQDVRLLQFAFPTEMEWQAGDVLQLRPCNSDAMVARFFDLIAGYQLSFGPETVVQLRSSHPEMDLPQVYEGPISLGEVAKYVWDLNAKPRQRFFEVLSINCNDELEREKLVEFSTVQGLDDMLNYINRPRRTVIEVLEDFRHATSKLTLRILFELFPQIQTRSFSIASMPSAGTLDLLVAVVEYRTKMSTPRLGLCSNWLKGLPKGSTVLGAIKAGTMCLPEDPLIPLIMVGPGTGIAPFRSIIQQRESLRDCGTEVGPMVVFFGCRNAAKDFHFSDDFKRWEAQNLVESFVAFSRDQEDKVYVQHLIRENAEKLRPLIKVKNACIFIAGSANSMPKEVKKAFVEVLEGDEAYVETMTKDKRYQEETWS